MSMCLYQPFMPLHIWGLWPIICLCAYTILSRLFTHWSSLVCLCSCTLTSMAARLLLTWFLCTPILKCQYKTMPLQNLLEKGKPTYRQMGLEKGKFPAILWCSCWLHGWMETQTFHSSKQIGCWTSSDWSNKSYLRLLQQFLRRGSDSRVHILFSPSHYQ